MTGTDTPTDPLVAFLNARLDEDEAIAETAGRSGFPAADYDSRWRYEDVDRRLSPVGVGPDTFPHIARHDPARVLREVEAKREILAAYVKAGATAPGGPRWIVLRSAVETLAGAYRENEEGKRHG